MRKRKSRLELAAAWVTFHGPISSAVCLAQLSPGGYTHALSVPTFLLLIRANVVCVLLMEVLSVVPPVPYLFLCR